MKNKKIIPLSVPYLKGNENKYVTNCIKDEWISTSGTLINTFEKKISKYLNVKYAVALMNGTSALQLALKIIGLKRNEEVIVPTLTFIAPINAICYNGGIPIFMDCDEYHNLNIEKTIDFIKKRTFFKAGFTYNKKTKRLIRAILPVHVWGNAVNLEPILSLCKKRNILMIEDASESIGTKYTKGKLKNKYTGTVGKIGCLSFNGNKLITTGAGGMILTNEKKIYEKAVYYSTQAKDNSSLYIHNEIGYNFKMTNIQSAIGLAQLEKLNNFLKIKSKINKSYIEFIKKIQGIELLPNPKYAENNYWLNLILIDNHMYHLNKKELMRKFQKQGIEVRPVWYLNHLQKPFVNYENYKISIAHEQLEKSLCLPSSINLKKQDLKRIVNILK